MAVICQHMSGGHVDIFMTVVSSMGHMIYSTGNIILLHHALFNLIYRSVDPFRS